jgi:hypothetical protein
MVGADGRLISVGISISLFLIVEVRESACVLAQEFFGDQIAIATDQLSRLAAPRNVKRHDDALEKALAPCFGNGRLLDERRIA